MTTITIHSHEINLSNPEKLYFPEQSFKKKDLIEYYRQIAPAMLPFLKNHPIVMHRFPNGITQSGFYQKEIPKYFPDWINRVTLEKEEGQITHPLCNNLESLIYMANQGCITFHTWLSPADHPNYPDRLVFDLDPSQSGFNAIIDAAQQLRAFLEDQLGLRSYVMTTGSRGLHVVIPLDGQHDFDTVRTMARHVAEALVQQNPHTLTTEMRKEDRGSRIFLDYLRNSYAQTSVPPYSVRPIPNAPVAAPLQWKELEHEIHHAQQFNIQSIFHRLTQLPDPWQGFHQNPCSLETALAYFHLKSA